MHALIICLCQRSPTANCEASVLMTKGLPKSGIYNTGASTSAFFRPSNAYWCVACHVHILSYVVGRVAVQIW